jgi:hypothetical protein
MVSCVCVGLREGCRKHNENGEPNEDEMDRARSTYGENRNSYSVSVRKPEGKRPPGRLRRRWEHNIKMDL